MAEGEAPRRWVSEAAVLDELERLNDTSMDLVRQYREHARAAAEAEASHKSARARRILLAKASRTEGRAMPISEAEVTAEADPEVSSLYMTRLTSAAMADATKEALRTIRTNQDGLRTAAASHRDMISGPGWKG